MNVKELLRKKNFAKVSDTYGIIPPIKTIPVNTVAPNKSMKKKSAVRPLNELSSSNLQYRARKNIWNRKSKSVKFQQINTNERYSI